MRQIWLMISVALIGALCGCQSLPHFEDTAVPEPMGPKVSDMVDEVQCEVITALASGRTDPQGALGGLQNGQYVASVNLTLDVTDNEGINPSLSYIDPLHTMGTNFTALFTPQASEQQHRNFTVSFTLLFDKSTATEPNVKKCATVRTGSGLKGNLGIDEIFATGLKYTTGIDVSEHYPYMMPAIGVGTLLAPSDPLTGSPALAPSFGSTVDFQLIYGAGGGPNWTLTHFVGPNPASDGLVSLMRTNKDTLVLSFSRVSPTAPPAPAAAGAAISAQDNITRMILQRITVH
jgi:hypothetical protein